MNRSVLLGCAALLSSAACADDLFYFKGIDDYLPWSDPASWSLTGVDGESAGRVPGEGDRLYGLQSRKVGLGGASVTIDGFNSNGNWDRHNTYLKNGGLTITGNCTSHSDSWYLEEAATLTWGETSTYTASNDHGAADEYYVGNGCVLNILGVFNNYKSNITVNEGGGCTLNPTRYGLYNSTAQKSTYTNRGQMSFPHGLIWQSGSGSSGAAVVLNQEAGTLILGGPLSKNGRQGRFTINLSGGTVQATGSVSFDADEVNVTAAALECSVDEGQTLDMGAATYTEGAVVTKRGAGRLTFGANMPLAVNHFGGVIAIEGENATLQLNGTEDASDECVVEIGAKGFTYVATGGAPVRFKVASGVFEVGDVILTCADETLLASAYQDLAATGMALEIVGSTLVKAESGARFVSTTITDLANAEGWEGGVLPAAGSEVSIDGAGVVAVVSSAIPDFSKITVKNGAELKVDLSPETEDAFPCVVLAGTGKLTVSGRMNVPKVDFLATTLGDEGEMPVIEVLANGVLTVPGGTAFKNCTLDIIRGSLLGTSDGPFVFGTAEEGEVSYFTMTADGATITALNANANENASRISFASPMAGGTVVVSKPIVLKDTTFTFNRKDGFAFGLNNPVDQSFQVVADKTDLDYGADTYIAGGANLVMTNGSILSRARHSEGETGDSWYNLIIQNRGKLTLVDRGELRTGVTRVNGNVTDGVVRLNPDEIGWIGLEVQEGGIGSWYKLNGLDKGTVRVANGTVECFTTKWWGWGNREHAFNKLVAVDIPAESTMTYLGVSPKFSTNKSTLEGTVFEAPFSGGGDLLVRNSRLGTTLEPTLARSDNTCTGRLSVGADEGTAKARLHIANGANWAGTVVLDGRTDLVPVDEDHPNAGLAPATVAFSGVELNEPFTFRVWMTKEGDEFSITNDVINVGAFGWTTVCTNGTLTFESKSSIGFSDLPPLTEIVLGRMPKGGTVPASSNGLIEIFEKEIEGDESESLLVARIKSSEFIFVGTDGSTDLNDESAWVCGRVPKGEDVVIRGPGVTATLDAKQGLPEFSSITLREGATLMVVGKDAEEKDFVLPSLLCDARSSIVIGDENETATTVCLASAPITAANRLEDGSVALTTLVIKKGATLVALPGMKFKNVDLKLYGTISKETTDGEGLYFGYAENGETSYFAMTSDAGCLDIHSNKDAKNGRKFFLSPAAGGRVKAVGDIVLKNTWLTVWGWQDYGEIRVGVNNPLDEVFNFVLDGTAFGTTATTSFGGAAQITLKNKSYINRDTSCHGHEFDTIIQDKATITVEGEGAYLDHNANGVLKMNGSAEGEVVLRDGGVCYCQSTRGTAQGVLVVSNGYLKAGKSWLGSEDRPRADVLGGFGAVQIEADSTLGIVADNSGNGESKFVRSITIADVPFTGLGDVFVRNDIANQSPFVVTLVNGASTCTGTIGVTGVAADAVKETVLEFANGANWAGVVRADENVRLVNGNEESAAASVTFGTLEVEKDKAFNIRLWKEGETIVSDQINLTIGTSGGGTLNIVPQGEAVLGEREKFVLGTAPAGAWKNLTLRVDGRRYAVRETPIEGSSLVTCTVQRESGLVLTIR